MKHTEGPWHAVGEWVEHARGDIADICICNPVDYGQGHLGRTHDEIVANATLIAAAPDMLKALRECESAFAKQEFHPSIFFEVRRAIKLAEGGFK